MYLTLRFFYVSVSYWQCMCPLLGKQQGAHRRNNWSVSQEWLTNGQLCHDPLVKMQGRIKSGAAGLEIQICLRRRRGKNCHKYLRSTLAQVIFRALLALQPQHAWTELMGHEGIQFILRVKSSGTSPGFDGEDEN